MNNRRSQIIATVSTLIRVAQKFTLLEIFGTGTAFSRISAHNSKKFASFQSRCSIAYCRAHLFAAGKNKSGRESCLTMNSMVRVRGLEPPWGEPHTDLNRTRLPIPPHPHIGAFEESAENNTVAPIDTQACFFPITIPTTHRIVLMGDNYP